MSCYSHSRAICHFNNTTVGIRIKTLNTLHYASVKEEDLLKGKPASVKL